MKKLFAVVAMVILASPAFAAVQNVKVSGSVTSYFVDRNDFNFKLGGQEAYNQNFFYTSTHVLISSDLSDNVSAQVGLANEVAWGNQNVDTSTSGSAAGLSNASDQQVDLELANVTLREFLYSPLTLTIGRQTLSYGNDFIIGAAGGPSVGGMANIATDMSRTQNYDGIRAVLDYKPLTIDTVYVKVNSHDLTGGTVNGIGKDDTDLYGAVANYQLGDAMSTVVEGAFWARTDDSTNTAFRGVKAGKLYVPDLRVSTNPTKDLSLGLEGATQMGVYVNTVTDKNEERSKVWAIQGKASYNIPVLTKYKPVLAETFSYYSGQNSKNNTNASETKYHGWDPIFNDQDLGTRIWRSLFTYTGLETSELSFSVNPLEDVTAQVVWTDLFIPGGLSTAGQAFGAYQYSAGLPDESTLSNLTVSPKKTGLGNEVDGILTYNYTEDVTFGLNLGIFVPGDAFVKANNSVAKEAIASVGVNF